jgi:outer membrane receptor protein involved in Fe transport
VQFGDVTRLGLAAAFFFVSPTAALAADEIEEIVVTATLREQPAREVPASVSVFTSGQIRDMAVQHFEELVNAVPNLNWSGDGNRARYFQIRGVGELEQYEGAPNPSVGFLIDDIDFSGIGSIATLFDLQQIEVLRGPQGTRYGANALAGMIYMRSTVPSAETDGRLKLTAGSDDAQAAGIAFGGSLDAGDSLLYRLSAQRYRSDGFRHNAYLHRDDTNVRDETTVHGRLRWLPADAWQIDAALLYADADDGYDAFALDNGYTTLSDKPGRDAQRSVGASVKAEYSGWDSAVLTAITSAADSDIDFGFDADWGNPDSWAPVTYDYVSVNRRSRSTLSQEVRLTSTDWLFGLYGLRLVDELTTINQGEYYDPGSGYADSLDDRLESRYVATNVAAFGQYRWQLGESTRITVGLRGEQRKTDYRDSSGLREAPSESMAGGALTLRHAHSPLVSSYLTLSRGYKAGGFNLGVVPEDRREFGTESLWNLEAGVKATLLDGTLSIDAAVFADRRRDQQVRTSFQLVPGDPASFVFYTDNAASGRMRGLEASLRYAPDDAWDWYLNVGLLDATFEDFVTPQVDLSGREQAHAPGYTLAAGGRYRNAAGFFIRLDATARDAFYFDVSNDQKSWPYALVHARVGYEADSWTIQLWARNLADRRYAVRGFYFGNEPPDFPDMLYVRLGDPRQLGITFDKRF